MNGLVKLGELDEKHREFVAVCETCAPHSQMAGYRWVGNGCPPSDRLALCKGFIAKAVWGFSTTRALIDALRFRPTLRRLCGWETVGAIPSEATFSRAFADFAHELIGILISLEVGGGTKRCVSRSPA